MSESPPEPASSPTLTCRGCGARLAFLPGTRSLTCEYCGMRNPIQDSAESLVEIDYESFLQEQYETEERMEVVAVRCDGCGATVSLDPLVTSDRCPYCSTALVVAGGSSSSLLKPRALAPFQIDLKKARAAFQNWLHGLWFAPPDLKRKSQQDRLTGVYVPYWTFDAETASDYNGERGDHYTDTESRASSAQRQARRTRWTPVSNRIQLHFDDVLVPATRSLNSAQVRYLEPWNLGELVPFQEDYLRGFRTQAYEVELTEGMKRARGIMEKEIRDAVRRDIGGDEQRIHSLETTMRDVTFKHILLPIWVSSFRYNGKIFRFLINGQSGEVQGKRPVSWFKVIRLLLGIAAAIFILVVVL